MPNPTDDKSPDTFDFTCPNCGHVERVTFATADSFAAAIDCGVCDKSFDASIPIQGRLPFLAFMGERIIAVYEARLELEPDNFSLRLALESMRSQNRNLKRYMENGT